MVQAQQRTVQGHYHKKETAINQENSKTSYNQAKIIQSHNKWHKLQKK